MRATRFAALAFVLVVVAAVIVALDEEGGDDDSVASPDVVPGSLDARRSAGARPLGDVGPDAAVPIAPAFATLDESRAAAGGTPAASAFVRGTLVDGRGNAIAGEPVRTELARDPWSPPPSDPRAPRERVETVSDAQGRFELPARGGGVYDLRAGGGRWAIVAWPDVRAGDDLVVRLDDGAIYTGLVLDAVSGAPVGGAYVSGSYDDETILARSAANGSFAIGPLPDGGVALGAWAPGYDVALIQDLSVSAAPFTLELPDPRTLSGTVTDRTSGAAIAGARLEFVVGGGEYGGLGLPLQRYEATTDARGAYALDEMLSLGFALHVEADGYVPATIDRHVVEAVREGEPRDVRLEPHQRLEGSATVEISGAAAAGASVRLEGPQGTIAEGRVDASGRYALPTDGWDGDGPLVVRALDAQGRSAREPLGRRAGEGPALVLREPADLVLRVLAGGQPVPGAEVRVFANGSEPSFALSDESGEARVRHERAGEAVLHVDVQARRDALLSRVRRIVLDELRGEPFTIDLEDAAWVQGRVLDVLGAPVASARVQVGAARDTVHSDRDGAFRFGPLEAGGPVRLAASAEGHRAVTQEVFAGGEEVVVVLPPEVLARGRVVDASTGGAVETFLARLTVVPWGESEARKGPRTRPDGAVPGGFDVPLADPGRYELRVTAPDYARHDPLVFDFDGFNAPPFLEVVVSPAAVLEIHVEDTLGVPVPGVQLGLVPWAAASGQEAPGRAWSELGRDRTDERGVARFELGDGGVFRLAAGAGAWIETGPLYATPGPPIVREVRVPATGALHVSVQGEGADRGGVRVTVRSKPGTGGTAIQRSARLRREAEGHATFEGLPPGAYEAWARGGRAASARLPVDVIAGMTAHRRLDMQAVDTSASSERAERRDDRAGR